MQTNIKLMILGFVFFRSALFAQKTDTTEITLGKDKKLVIIEKEDSMKTKQITYEYKCRRDTTRDKKKKFNGHWFGLELGFNSYFKQNFSHLLKNEEYLELDYTKSIGVNINFLEKNINLQKNKFGIVTGLGLIINNYRFNKNITLISEAPYLDYKEIDTVKFEKNKLTVVYLSTPLFFEAQMPVGKKKLFISAGIYAGINIGTHVKQVYELDGKRYKNKIRKDFHVNPFRYGVGLKIGYAGLNLFANYGLCSVFEYTEGPRLYPLITGIGFYF